MSTVQPGTPDHRLGMILKFAYSVIGLLLGFSCIVTGGILSANGVYGHTSLIASVLGLNAQVSDAPPGVVVFIVGIFMVWITAFRVKHITEKVTGGNRKTISSLGYIYPSRKSKTDLLNSNKYFEDKDKEGSVIYSSDKFIYEEAKHGQV